MLETYMIILYKKKIILVNYKKISRKNLAFNWIIRVKFSLENLNQDGVIKIKKQKIVNHL